MSQLILSTSSSGVPRTRTARADISAISLHLRYWCGWLTLAAVVSSVVSIFLCSFFFALALLLTLILGTMERKWPLQMPSYFPFLLIFLAAVFVATLFSPDFPENLVYWKKAIRYVYILLIFSFLDASILRYSRIVILALSLSALLGILQFAGLKEVDLLNRIDGFMSHWMTYSGQLMIGLVVVVGLLVFRRAATRPFGKKILVVLALILGGALILTMTRNAWLGAGAGLFVMLAIRRVYWSLGGLICILVLLLFAPSDIHDRMRSAFDPQDKTTQGRIELVRTGLSMIASSPLTGVGPHRVPLVARSHRETNDFPAWHYQHLHNNFLQVAAGAGIPALFLWILLWIKVFLDFFRLRQSSSSQEVFQWASIGIGVLTAFLVSGLLEYNFGDSEVLILLFFFITLPYIFAREAREGLL